ncbi:MAG: hypothetical protein WDO18_15925 [Acidobacteriota bacterium]
MAEAFEAGRVEDFRRHDQTGRLEGAHGGRHSLGQGEEDRRISVLDPSEYQVAEAAMRDDMEFTVVHELVHLRLASLPKSDSSRSTEEAAVNSITEALIALDRH